MSLNAMNVVWLYYPSGGPKLVLALALADEADDYGGGISASQVHLARKTRQTERAVQNQIGELRRSGLLELLKAPAGRGQPTEYRLNLAMLLDPQKDERGSTDPVQKGRTPFVLSEPETTNGVRPFSGLHIKDLKETPQSASGDVATFALSAAVGGDEDERLARWMFDLLRKLNPGHRTPSWPTWCKDIRRMREHDKRAHRDIAVLFAWVNADPFWQANILSPGTLRRQWERLELQRRRSGGGGVQALRQDGDTRCSWDKGGTRCSDEGVFGHPDGKRYCRKHEEEEERERART